jgi:uncharacterized protein (TIGR03032 family)
MANSFPASSDLDALWLHHHAQWRDTAQIVSQWQEASKVDPRLLDYVVQGAWWEILEKAGITLLVTREYEHLVMAMKATPQGPAISYLPLPHPSGMVIDQVRNTVHIASTRNPNQVYDLMPVTARLSRKDLKKDSLKDYPLVPVRSRFLPGCLYIHDLALIGNALYANAVGENAIVQLYDDGRYQRVWWPKCIESPNGPVFCQNHLQLNSIAAGGDLKTSYFSASTDKLSARRPGHKNFPVNQNGVVFSGATREPVAYGLTRPHSARLNQGRVWVDNSGYGELGFIDCAKFVPVAQLPGWTRGLCFHQGIAFVGTSRVLPRFRQYAPGLDVDASRCGVHAVDLDTGEVLGSLTWPSGNQIFAIDWVSSQITSGFPFSAGRRASTREKELFYAFNIADSGDKND